VERTSTITAREMKRLEPKLRIMVKTAAPSVIWWRGRVAKAKTVIGVKAKLWPSPIR